MALPVNKNSGQGNNNKKPNSVGPQHPIKPPQNKRGNLPKQPYGQQQQGNYGQNQYSQQGNRQNRPPQQQPYGQQNFPSQQQGRGQGQYPPYSQQNRPQNTQERPNQYNTQGSSRPSSNRPIKPDNSIQNSPDEMVYSMGEYDVDAQAAKFNNLYDEEDPFETLSVDEQIEADNNENPFDDEDEEFSIPVSKNSKNSSIEKPVKKQSRIEEDEDDEEFVFDDLGDPDEEEKEEEKETPKQKKNKRKAQARAKKRKRQTDQEDKDAFVDTDKLKIEPLGGKRKVRVSRYDSRKNRKQKALIIQWVSIGLLVLILIVGFKNALFPPASLTQEDVSTVIAQDLDLTEFPTEKGKGFAQDFMKAYLTVNPDKDLVDDQILGYFYTGSMDGSAEEEGISGSGNIIQNIVYGPTVYEETSITDYSSSFVVGAYVQQFKPDESLKKGEDPPAGSKVIDINGTKYRTSNYKEKWVFFSVGVFYDPKTDSMTISKSSPTLIPNYTIMSATDTPDEAPIGDGETDDDLTAELTGVVREFFKSYRVSSANNYSPLNQYTIQDPPVSLQTGLDSSVDFDGDPESAIEFEAARSVTEGEYRVKATVQWATQIGDSDKLTFSSTYFISFIKDTDGKYLVSDIIPMPYIPNDEFLEGDEEIISSTDDTSEPSGDSNDEGSEEDSEPVEEE